MAWQQTKEDLIEFAKVLILNSTNDPSVNHEEWLEVRNNWLELDMKIREEGEDFDEEMALREWHEDMSAVD